LEYTPQELSAILFLYVEDRYQQLKMDYERTRIQTFFLISVQVPKKHSFTYDKFKKDWPFAWDTEKRPGRPDPGEGVMSPEQWKKILNK
jgi:hypothetical protein